MPNAKNNKQPIKIPVSIIIPVYNREKLVCQTINNLLLQTYTHFEIIVIDDASKDNTYNIIRELAEKNQKIRCLQNPINLGAQAARNRGIQSAQFEWIAFQDSDDLWDPKKLERQMAELQKIGFDPMTVVHSNCMVHYHGKKKKVIWEFPETQGDGAFKQLLSRSTVLFPAILTSKKALEAIGCLDEKVPSYQEWDTAIRLAQHCKFIHIREPLFIYNIHSGYTISKDGEKADAGYRYVIDKFRKEILENCGENAWNNHLRNLWNNALSAGLWEKSDSYLKQSALNEVEIIDSYREKVYYFLENKLWHYADYLLKRMSQKEYIHQVKQKELRILRFLAKYHINPHYFLAVRRRLKYLFSQSIISI